MTRLRVLLHCVTRVGIGHFVRTREIARAVAEQHDAYLVDDGAPVPDRPIHAAIHRISLPSVIRDGDRVRSGQESLALAETLALRRDKLLNAVRAIRPHCLCIEHFPFSKQEHRDEIVPLIEAARANNPGVRVVCSIRDLAPLPNYRPVDDDYRRVVLDTLHRWFDALMVHADPTFVAIGDSLEWKDALRLPLSYTGFVAEPLSSADNGPSPAAHPGLIIVSGGGRRDAGLYEGCVLAWRELARRGKTAGRNMVLIAPAGLDIGEVCNPRLLDRCAGLMVEPFAPALVDRLSAASLSISQGGYNTCTNVLLTGVRAILVPNSNSSDQVQRAHLMQQQGLCAMIAEDGLDPIYLADVIERQLATAPHSHNIDLEGARRSAQLLESWTISGLPRPQPPKSVERE